MNLRQVSHASIAAEGEALAIVPPVCEALQYANESGIVHRDIKPENLLLDKDGRIKIADFGIAKILGTEVATEEKSAGTPEYMAPEQHSAPETSDHRADIYSLGVVLYEMLTGELPSSKLEPRSSRLRAMHLDVRLDEIVLRALHARPELRYRTALDLKTQIEMVTAAPSAAHSAAPHGAGSSEIPLPSKRAASSVLDESKRSSAVPRRRPRRRMAWLGVSFLVVLVGAMATSFLLPREYFAKVTMELPPDKESSARPWLADRLHTQFLAVQFQLLRRSEILGPVVEQLDLAKTLSNGRELSVPELSARLAKSVEIREIPNTGLVELGVYNRDPALAAKITNTIAKTYQGKRFRDIQASVDRALALINHQVENQRKRLAESKAEMEKIRVTDSIVDSAPESFDSALGTADHNVLDLEKQMSERAGMIANVKIQLQQISKLKPEQMKEVMRILKIEDPIMGRTVDRLNEARLEEARLTQEGLAENHRKILALRAQMAEFSRQLAEMHSTVQQSRATILQIDEDVLTTLQERLNEAKAYQVDEKKKLGPYIEAKNRYLQEKKVFEAAQIKFSTERLVSGIDFTPVKIWEQADVPVQPAWPNVRRLWQDMLP